MPANLYSAEYWDEVMEIALTRLVGEMAYLRDMLTAGGRVVGQRKLTTDEQRDAILAMTPEEIGEMYATRPRAAKKAERLLEVKNG